MTACSFAVEAHVCWNWGVRAGRTAIPPFILGRTLSTCRSLDMRRLGSIRRPYIGANRSNVYRFLTIPVRQTNGCHSDSRISDGLPWRIWLLYAPPLTIWRAKSRARLHFQSLG